MNLLFFTSWTKRRSRHVSYDFFGDPLVRTFYVALGLLLIGSVLFFVFRHRSTESVVSQRVRWELKINIEKFKTVQQSSWDLPSDAREVSTRWELHHTYQYVSGSTISCSTIGKTRSCTSTPTYSTGYVYADKYYYSVDRWTVDRVPTTSGSDFDISWPDTSDLRLSKSSLPHLEDEREGTRFSHFQVIFVNSDHREFPVDMVESMWRQFKPGTRAHLSLNIFGTVMSVEP